MLENLGSSIFVGKFSFHFPSIIWFLFGNRSIAHSRARTVFLGLKDHCVSNTYVIKLLRVQQNLVCFGYAGLILLYTFCYYFPFNSFSFWFYYWVLCGGYHEYMSLIVVFYLNPVKPVSNTVATSSQTTPTGKWFPFPFSINF